MTYSEKLKDPRWQKKRLFILERDDWTCRDCRNEHRPLQVHHFFYARGQDPWEADDRLLITLCDDCHARRQEMENASRLHLAMVFSTLPVEFASGFAESLAGAAEHATGDQLKVMGAFKADYLADVRWFDHALTHPEARPFYEHVTGNIGMTWPIDKEDAA